jgi:hypothetical protein
MRRIGCEENPCFTSRSACQAPGDRQLKSGRCKIDAYDPGLKVSGPHVQTSAPRAILSATYRHFQKVVPLIMGEFRGPCCNISSLSASCYTFSTASCILLRGIALASLPLLLCSAPQCHVPRGHPDFRMPQDLPQNRHIRARQNGPCSKGVAEIVEIDVAHEPIFSRALLWAFRTDRRWVAIGSNRVMPPCQAFKALFLS